MNTEKEQRNVEYDTKNTFKIIDLLKNNIRGLTITEIADKLKLNRHTVTKILEKLLIEKRVNYEEKGAAKIFYYVGEGKFVGKIDQGKQDTLWIDIFKPYYADEEEIIRINQTKHDNLIRASSKYRSVGAIAIKKKSLVNLIRLLRDVAKEDLRLDI
ncbi:MAG: MarR family transcriptional regulator [Candidatus Aenigmarchaeota archaeon]|nr:MarR family transcriptional regulator [Candidatus Aenigmarchaeota archaeon]MBU5689222.1 MarR family transcriptional regulator [Candidatus Aenigmarchaeota archaeon]